jgi:hypothetical protein
VPHFKPGKALREAVDERTAQEADDDTQVVHVMPVRVTPR